MIFWQTEHPPLKDGGQRTDHLRLVEKVGLSQLESRL
jgi:hypothetical protein